MYAHYGHFANIMKENQKKSFDFAAETTKQLITISTAIITLTVAFSKDILDNVENPPRLLLGATWACFIISIIFGVMTLMTLTGTLYPMKKDDPEIAKDQILTDAEKEKKELEKISINNGNIRFISSIQALFFVAAIIMTGLFGYMTLAIQPLNNNHRNEYMIIRNSTLNNDSAHVYTDTLYLKPDK